MHTPTVPWRNYPCCSKILYFQLHHKNPHLNPATFHIRPILHLTPATFHVRVAMVPPIKNHDYKTKLMFSNLPVQEPSYGHGFSIHTNSSLAKLPMLQENPPLSTPPHKSSTSILPRFIYVQSSTSLLPRLIYV
jgi:hypothetical protein